MEKIKDIDRRILEILKYDPKIERKLKLAANARMYILFKAKEFDYLYLQKNPRLRKIVMRPVLIKNYRKLKG